MLVVAQLDLVVGVIVNKVVGYELADPRNGNGSVVGAIKTPGGGNALVAR